MDEALVECDTFATRRCSCLCGEYGSRSVRRSDDAREMTPRLSSLMPTPLRRCRCGCLCGEYGSVVFVGSAECAPLGRCTHVELDADTFATLVESVRRSDDAREMTPRLS